MYATSTVTPGTWLSLTSRRATAMNTVEPVNSPKASWFDRSRSSAVTIRGENWPMASCTATVITVSTTEISVISDVRIVLSSVCTAGEMEGTAWPASCASRAATPGSRRSPVSPRTASPNTPPSAPTKRTWRSYSSAMAGRSSP